MLKAPPEVSAATAYRSSSGDRSEEDVQGVTMTKTQKLIAKILLWLFPRTLEGLISVHIEKFNKIVGDWKPQGEQTIAEAIEAGRYEGWSHAIRAIRSSLEQFPNGGMDIGIYNHVLRLRMAAVREYGDALGDRMKTVAPTRLMLDALRQVSPTMEAVRKGTNYCADPGCGHAESYHDFEDDKSYCAGGRGCKCTRFVPRDGLAVIITPEGK